MESVKCIFNERGRFSTFAMAMTLNLDFRTGHARNETQIKERRTYKSHAVCMTSDVFRHFDRTYNIHSYPKICLDITGIIYEKKLGRYSPEHIHS